MDTQIRTPFLESYIQTALWSSTDENGCPLDDAKYADAELATSTLARFAEDCRQFQEQGEKLYPEYFVGRQAETTAHDFWLTRNRHGAGFWDGDYPKEIGKALTDLAHSFGECDLFVSEGMKVYC